jgi:hypothetical protein
MQENEIHLECQELIDYTVLRPGCKENRTIYLYLEIKKVNGEKCRIWIKPYTKRQVGNILKMIQERGGFPNKILNF